MIGEEAFPREPLQVNKAAGATAWYIKNAPFSGGTACQSERGTWGPLRLILQMLKQTLSEALLT